jgi:S-ribosylhomocysteine lyase LuxS involved in autoinducer biosynthesis
MRLTHIKLVIIFVLFRVVISNQIYTKTQLRGFHQKTINETFEEKIKEIIKAVIQSANNNQTSYTQIICLNNNYFSNYDYTILNKKSDDIIIQRLQDTLIDSNITIIEYSLRFCAPNYNEYDEKKINSRKLIINW